MNAHRCCAWMQITRVDPHPHSRKRRLFDRAGKVFPAFAIVMLPKCPACLAAYITVATGIGVSLTAATYIRFFLLGVCVLTLCYFAVTTMRQLRVRLRTHNSRFERSNV
jgi:hypothetical protein